MKNEIERIARQLEKAFDKQPWYGRSIKDLLGEINPEIVHRKVGPHSIIVLLMHMIAWRRYVTRKLSGDNDFRVTDEENFPTSTGGSEAWGKAVSELDKSQQELLAAIRDFPDDKLDQLVPAASHKYTWYTLLHGIIQHDIYHLGQIALLKKALD